MKKATDNEYAKRIIKVLNYIQTNLDEKHDLVLLSSIAFFSPFHFHRIFKAFTGESIKKYIRRLKIERAANSLKYSDRLISIISLKAGYENTESFSRVFKKHFNKSPMEYRKESQKDLKESINNLSKSKVITDISIKTIYDIPDRNLICMRHTGDYNEAGKVWNKLIGWVYKNNYKIKTNIGISYDNPQITEGDKIRYDACVELTVDAEPGDKMFKRTLIGGRFVVATINGPYESLNDAYNFVYAQWLSKNRFELRNEPGYEVYINMTPDDLPKNYITEIYFPVV